PPPPTPVPYTTLFRSQPPRQNEIDDTNRMNTIATDTHTSVVARSRRHSSAAPGIATRSHGESTNKPWSAANIEPQNASPRSSLRSEEHTSELQSRENL